MLSGEPAEIGDQLSDRGLGEGAIVLGGVVQGRDIGRQTRRRETVEQGLGLDADHAAPFSNRVMKA